jgi:transposase-like protein
VVRFGTSALFRHKISERPDGLYHKLECASGSDPISYRNLHFPSSIIQRAVWLYARFNLSLRDVEELMAERGVEVSYETIRRWLKRFGPAIARGCDEGVRGHTRNGIWTRCMSRLAGAWMYLWRAIDQNGEVLDILVQARRDKRAALKLMRKLLKKHGLRSPDPGNRQMAGLWRSLPRTRPRRLASPGEMEE